MDLPLYHEAAESVDDKLEEKLQSIDAQISQTEENRPKSKKNHPIQIGQFQFYTTKPLKLNIGQSPSETSWPYIGDDMSKLGSFAMTPDNMSSIKKEQSKC